MRDVGKNAFIINKMPVGMSPADRPHKYGRTQENFTGEKSRCFRHF